MEGETMDEDEKCEKQDAGLRHLKSIGHDPCSYAKKLIDDGELKAWRLDTKNFADQFEERLRNLDQLAAGDRKQLEEEILVEAKKIRDRFKKLAWAL